MTQIRAEEIKILYAYENHTMFMNLFCFFLLLLF
jgi:hypothetical protein